MSGPASRLIVASNRLPVVMEAAAGGGWTVTPAVGGLVTALLPVLRHLGGTWVGWPGVSDADEASLARELDGATEGQAYRLAAVPLSAQEVNDFYRGFSNEVVWPLFHDLFTNCVFEPAYWQSYEAVNRRFAQVISRDITADDVVWVQDYHLMNVAAELRAMGLRNRIGFFLHVPFPGPDIFMKLPWRDRIMQALLSFNHLGFQAERDQVNFLACAERLAGPTHESADASGICLRLTSQGTAPIDRDGEPIEVVVSAFPISIDFADFAERANSKAIGELGAHLRREFQDRHLLLGIDRLDYSKGLPQKLAAFRLMLERHPDMHRQVTLVQHVVPSRENVPGYRRQRLEVERMVGEINGAFSEPGWVPVHYYYHTLSQDELLAWYRTADAALITPLKDGMNLVAKEFCACHVDDRGVLILSEFAGAAVELGEHALLVNPFDVEGVARAIRRAYLMDRGEQQLRMKALRAIIRNNDVHRWAERCLAASAQGRCRAQPSPRAEGASREASSKPPPLSMA
jgi:trehalose 6-phosphate synthase